MTTATRVPAPVLGQPCRSHMRGGPRPNLRGGPRPNLRGGPRQDQRGGPRPDQRGAASVELVIVFPVLLLILALMVAGWRMSAAKSEVTMAAQAGARAASLALSGAQARKAAQYAVNANLANAGVTCSATSVSVDVSDFAKPVGQSGTVRVTVTCTVPLAELLVPGLPGHVVAQSTASSALDTFRRRQP